MPAVAGCGDRLVDGGFLGDATLRVHGELYALIGQPQDAMVGAIWLGYSALSDRSQGIETTVFPITSIQFPSSFSCDILDPPPSAGRYLAADGHVIPAFFRIARVILFDDIDGDGRVALDPEGKVLLPDKLLARSEDQDILFVEQAPAAPADLDGSRSILDNWQDASPGFHVVQVDRSVPSPDLAGRVVANDTPIVFETPVSPVSD